MVSWKLGCLLLLQVATVSLARKVQVKDFKIVPCNENANYSLTMQDIVVEFRGTKLVVAGEATVEEDLTSPLKVEVLMRAKLTMMSKRITVPCVDGLGSCTYEDVCSLGESLNGTCKGLPIPCECPIKQGVYKLPTTELPISSSTLSQFVGIYAIKVDVTRNGDPVACYKITFSLGR